MSTKSNDLFDKASKARTKSYSPYSGRRVGAAVLMADGKIYTGANVENSSYGGTICAERAAIHTAITQGTSHKIKEIMVVTDANPPWPPCGLCRQVISEFADSKTKVHFTNLKGKKITRLFKDLLPFAFTPGHLLKKRAK